MNINRVYIENFKCFDSFEMLCRDLTILTGYNAAGKSSSTQPLLLISEVLRQNSRSRILSLNTQRIRLGAVGDIFNRNAKSKSVIFSLSSLHEQISWKFLRENVRDGGVLYLESTKFIKKSEKPIQGKEFYPSDAKNSKLLEEVRDLIFVSPGRLNGIEAYPTPKMSDVPVGDVGSFGQYGPYWYTELVDEEVEGRRRHPKEERTTVRGQIDAWISDIFPEVNVNAEKIESLSLVKLEFKIGRSGNWARPSNVGYGLNYIFPIIVALVTARVGSLLVIDSPEAHLHPRGQTLMGRMLAFFASAGVQIFVETHSDHVFSGVRLGIRENMLDSSQAIVHFFSHSGGKASRKTDMLTIEKDGGVAEWPVGFFDQSEEDLARLAGWR